jgi:ORF6N domain
MPKTKRALAVPVDQISQTILVLRGHRVLLDAELASLYGVTTKRLNEQAKRNAERFPADFMFQLTAEESSSLRSQCCNPQLPGDPFGEARIASPARVQAPIKEPTFHRVARQGQRCSEVLARRLAPPAAQLEFATCREVEWIGG